MSASPPRAAILVAAGTGSRAGGAVPKQYAAIGGKAVIAHAVDALAADRTIGTIVVAIGAGQEALAATALGDRAVCLVSGGATRRASVAAGLAALDAVGDAGQVLVHDAARPFLPVEVLDRLWVALDTADGAVPVMPAVDTLVVAGDVLGAVIPREGVARVQTPQAFRIGSLRAAHAGWDGPEPTDDAQMVRAAGAHVVTVAGAAELEKLTLPADLAAAGARMTYITRTGLGFDVHAFAEGDHVMLCGVKVPHSHKLAGHSDADVGLHAITDALLGTIADGDIGAHFPPSDPRWKGADSEVFLRHAASLVAAQGGIIDHVDVTIMCEVPKVGPHRLAMRARIAEMLDLAIGSVSVKATTTERLGFTGRREGMAAQAVASVRMAVGG